MGHLFAVVDAGEDGAEAGEAGFEGGVVVGDEVVGLGGDFEAGGCGVS